MTEITKKALIVGAGISGLAAAYELNKSGMNVTVLEKTDGTDNCSYGNAGLIAPRYITPLASPGVINQGLKWMFKKESPFYIHPRLNKELIKWVWKFKRSATEKHVNAAGPILRDLILRNQVLIENILEEEQLDFDYFQNGHLTICETEAGLKKEIESAKRAEALGITATVLSEEQVFEKEALVPENTIGAVYYPKDAHLNPNKLMNSLKKSLIKKGVVFKTHKKIVNVLESSTKGVELITAERESFAGDIAIVCSGVWTSDLVKNLNYKIPIQAGKGYSITLKNPPDIPRYNFTMAEKKVAVTPMKEAMRFAGTMEVVGRNTSITKPKVNAIKKAILEFFPQYTMTDLDKESIWVGLRPCSPDGMPYIGKLANYENIYISSGYSMIGMSLSFAAAEVLRQLITQGNAELNHPLIDPNRFLKT